MFLNRQYYQDLHDRYKDVNILDTKLADKCSLLTIKIILEQCKINKPIHINLQLPKESLYPIGQHLFIELANKIFHNEANFPQLKIGDILKSNEPIRVGTPKPRYLTFTIVQIKDELYTLENAQYSLRFEKTFTKIVQKFTPITQNAQNETITNFSSFFEKLNSKSIHGFTPTFFDRKSVFIASKKFYDFLDVKTKIPITYIPNPREECNLHEIKSIPALPDSMMYFAPRYQLCYESVLLKGIKVDTIVVLNTDENIVEQIIHDQNRIGFNLMILTSSLEPSRYSQIPLWNWFKEEVDIVNTL